MDRLRQWFYANIQRVDTSFKRYLWNEINWNSRLIIITGARGVGKTTILLQYIKANLPVNEETLYVSLDDIYFSKNSLIDFAEEFIREGGKYLFIDEAQKYPGWSKEIKNIYDNYPDLQLVVSGSSSIELLKSEGDLSRRALYYNLNGMSFREYLNFEYNHDLVAYKLDDLLTQSLKISQVVNEQTKIFPAFNDYLKYGYYPFYKEDKDSFHKRLQQVINTVLELDIRDNFQVDANATHLIKKLMAEIASMVPFKPNIKKLSEKIGITRDTLVKYLQLLDKADLISLVYSQARGVSILNKPEKILLNNSNLAYALNDQINKGSLKESYFVNQLKLKHKIRYAEAGDFIVDDIITFEVGGKNKTKKQIANIENAWIAADDMEYAIGNKIPLWLFGFTY
ncbi:ATP-binding protein [Marivirga sp.]|uniref:ATP-binding protein n=1 Tax=Marivirga sp. TaxID=2018662 RepID=UPI002D803F3F|nr:AAA family ATPase [Marivirga sp.]HET8861508.1 AAA family ATPase [Marivirga sp.]